MRRLLIAVSVAVSVIVAAAPAQAQAQSRSRSYDRIEDAIALPPRVPPGVAELVLAHASELALADSQRVILESIRKMQDSANRPWIARLDSLRPSRRPANPADLSPEQVEEIESRRQAIDAVLEQIKEPNAIARQRAMAVLSPEQREKAADLENDARKQAEEDRARRGREAYGMDDRRRGYGGAERPPED